MQDPVASGIINSLAKPGNNLTGVQIRGSIPKTVEWMLKVSPAIKHFFVPIKYDTKAAEQSLLRRLESNPYDPSAHYELALVFADRGDDAQAIQHLETALELTDETVTLST